MLFQEIISKLINKKSALLASDLDLPSPTDLDDPEITEDSARAVWVPNRNGVMLSIAAALAEARSLDAILVGFNKEEAATFPDNTPEYMQAFEAALKFSTLNQIKVLSATKDMNKTEIVQSVHEHEFPFELLWSCYRNFEGMHCGQCESCKRLSRALEQGLSHDLYSKVHAEIFG